MNKLSAITERTIKHILNVFSSHIVCICRNLTRDIQVALQEAELQPEETLFIDDAEVNCQAAASTGIQVAHYTPGTDLGDLFK